MIDRTIERARHAVELLETRGELALQRTKDWEARTLDGLHTDNPSETLSESERRALVEINGFHDRLRRAIHEFEKQAAIIVQIVKLATPQGTTVLESPAQVAVEGWCRSCWRDQQHLEPIAVDRDGQRRYRDLCRRCGEWATAHQNQHPPLAVLRVWHQGRRLSEREYRRITRQP